MATSPLDQLNKDRQRLNTQGTQVANAKANPSPSQARGVGIPPLAGRAPRQQPQNRQQIMQGRPVFQSRNAPRQAPTMGMSGGMGVGGGGQQAQQPAPLASTYQPPPPGPPPIQMAPTPGDVSIPPPGSPGELPGAMTPEEQRNQAGMNAIDDYLGGASEDMGLEVPDPYAIPTDMQGGQPSTDQSMRDALVEAILAQLGMGTAQEEQQQIELMQGQLNDSVLNARAGFGSMGGFGGAIAAGAAEGDIRRAGALEQGAAITDIRNAGADRAAKFGELALGQQGQDFDRELWEEYKAYLDMALAGDGRSDTPPGGGGGPADIIRQFNPFDDEGFNILDPDERNRAWMELIGRGDELGPPDDGRQAGITSASEVGAGGLPPGSEVYSEDSSYTYYQAPDGKWYKVAKPSTVVDDGTTAQDV